MYLDIINEPRFKRNKHVAVKFFEFSWGVKRSYTHDKVLKLFILATETQS